MDLPYFGSTAPNFRIPTQPELERALNILSRLSNENKRNTPSFTGSGTGVHLNTDGKNVVFNLDTEVEATDRGKFFVHYDSDLGRLYVSEGYVQFLVGNEIVSILPKIKGNSIAQYGRTEYNAAKCNGDPNGVYFSDSDWFEKTEVYVKVDAEASEIYLRDVRLETPPPLADEFPNSVFVLIATIEAVSGYTQPKIVQKWNSDILLVKDFCPFEISDATKNRGDTPVVKILSTKVRVPYGTASKRYPKGMSATETYLVEAENDSKWFAVYLKYKFDFATKLVGDKEEDVEILVKDYYVTNTYDTQYELLGTVTISYDPNGKRYISDIQNVCWLPDPDINKLEPYCPFKVTDVSEVGSGGSLIPKIKIQTDYIEGVAPNGMVDDPEKPYIIKLDDSVIRCDFAYVYLKTMVNEKNLIDEYDKAVTIEVSPFLKTSGSFIQWTLIAEIKIGGELQYRYIESIKNQCPSAYIHPIKECPFEVEDATDAEGVVKVQIGRFKVGDKYPVGMEDDNSPPYQIDVPTSGEWFGVYLVALLDKDGAIKEVQNALTLEVSDKEENNTSEIRYFLIAELTVSNRDKEHDPNESRYISYLKNYCQDINIGKSYCPFEIYDASSYDEDGKALNAKVLVSNYSVFGDRYPEGMGENTEFVLTIEKDDTKVGDIVPSVGICYIYLNVLVDEFGEVHEYATALTIEKTSRWYGDRGCCVQKFMIGSVQVDNTGPNPTMLSVSPTCPRIELNRDSCCPFLVEDASEDGVLKVQIRTGKIAGKYPKGMEEKSRYILELPKIEKPCLVYCISVITADGFLHPNREDGDDYVSFDILEEYPENTDNIQYDLIAVVTTNEFEIVSIQNSCFEPTYKKPDDCPFALYDASTYEYNEQKDEWAATDAKVLVTQSSLQGKYPTGMSGSDTAPDYILTFEENDFDQNSDEDYKRSYVYLLAIVNDDGELYDTQNSLTVQKSPYYYESDNSTYQRILIGYVDCFFGTTGGPVMVNGGVRFECPDLSLRRPSDCLFKIEDASTLTEEGEKAVVIRNGKVNDRYPKGMGKDKFLKIPLPSSDAGTYYVYCVIKIDSNGNVVEGVDGDDSIEFKVESEYKQNTSALYYAIIGTVDLKENGQLYIQSFCLDPSLPKISESCSFKTTDASEWGSNSNVPTKIKIRIANSKICCSEDGEYVYPTGMGDESDFVMELALSDFNDADVCYIYAKAMLTPNGRISSSAGSLTIEKSKTFLPKGNFIQHIPIAHVYLGAVVGGNGGKEIVKITNFCPSGELNEINNCNFYTEDVTDYDPSSTSQTQLKILIANGTIYGGGNPSLSSSYLLPDNMSTDECFVWNLSSESEVQYVCCSVELGRYGIVKDGGEIEVTVLNYKPRNTSNYQWFILATVYVDKDEKVITSIDNYCYTPEVVGRNCPFSVTDATVYSGQTVDLKVEVDIWSVPNTESSTYPNGRVPAGMSQGGDYILDVPNVKGWYGVFLNIEVNQLNEILTYQNAITLSLENDFVTGTSTYQRFYIAGITVSEDSNSKLFISDIDNQCPRITLNPIPECPFLVEDASTENECKIQIRSGRVANKYPTGMTADDTYKLTISDEQDWWAVYCGMVVSNGEIQTGDGQVTFFTSDKYLTDTESYVNFKIAEIQVYKTDDNKRYVGWVQNTCAVPFVAGGASLPCPFKVLDVSDEDGFKINISWGLIWNMLPVGMEVDDDPKLIMNISGTSFVYSEITFDSDLIVTDVRFGLYTDLKTNTSSVQYNLIAVVTVTGSGDNQTMSIKNICVQPFPSPCSLL